VAEPNILFIFSDQHRFDCVGVNGHPLVQTPNLDRLAAEGVNFTQAYCPSPICTPSRLSLLHGQWPTQHLGIANSEAEAPRPPDPGLPTFSQVLHDAGYFTGYVGKWHAYPKQSPLDFGFDRFHHYDEYLTWRQARGIPLLDEQNWYFGELDPHIDADHSRLAWGAETTLALIAECAQAGHKFFIRYDPTEPHLPNQVPEPYFSQLYSPHTIRPWPSFPDPLVNKPYIQAQMRRTWKVDSWTWEEHWAPIVSRYLGEITLMDRQIGRILDGLEALGLAENMLVIYSSDHGDLCGAHGMIDKHYVMYDDVVRVPLIMRWPGVISPGANCDAFVSHSLDLASTLCDAAGIASPSSFRGQSLLPLARGQSTTTRQDIFTMYFGNQFGLYSQRMVRDRRWKYIWNPTAQDELYDLELDPGELHNLASQPEARETLAQLRKRLVEWMRETDDLLLNDWTERQLLEGLKI
jgi:arylsulfatase A-like enzyme